jgi:hypothetical protein
MDLQRNTFWYCHGLAMSGKVGWPFDNWENIDLDAIVERPSRTKTYIWWKFGKFQKCAIFFRIRPPALLRHLKVFVFIIGFKWRSKAGGRILKKIAHFWNFPNFHQIYVLVLLGRSTMASRSIFSQLSNGHPTFPLIASPWQYQNVFLWRSIAIPKASTTTTVGPIGENNLGDVFVFLVCYIILG